MSHERISSGWTISSYAAISASAKRGRRIGDGIPGAG
jgi:hypothetical protein